MSNEIARLICILAVGLMGLFSDPSNAAMFTRCAPDSQMWEFKKDEADKAQAQQREKLRCDAVNAAIDAGAANLKALDDAKRKATEAANAGRWDEYRAALETAKAPMLSLQKDAEANPAALGAGNLRSLFGQDLNFLFQNAGLEAPASFDDAMTKIEEASRTPGKESKAATLAANLIGQASTRGAEMIDGIARAAGDKVTKETQAIAQAQQTKEREKLTGSTTAGYVGGFGKRITSVWSPFLFMLLVVCFVGGWIGLKRKQNPVVAGVAAGLSYLVPGVCMALALIFLPFLPEWFVIACTLAGTLTIYYFSQQVFGWLAVKVGVNTPTGRRLLLLGGALYNLRTSMQTAQAVSGASDMAASMATHGSARLGTADEAREAGHLIKRGEKPKEVGVAVARVSDAPAGYDQRFRCVGHIVTVAPTGSGKGVGAVLPNLLEYPGSMVVTDYKGENVAVTVRARRAMGHKVCVVDPFKVTEAECSGFNVLDRVDPTNPDCVGESATLADCMVIPDEKGGGKFFDDSAKNLLQGLILYISSLPDDRRNLGELRRILGASEESFMETMAEMAADESLAFGLPARAANTIMGMSDRGRGDVLSTARLHTAFLDETRVAGVLAKSDFDIAGIKSELMTIYLVLPPNQITTHARFIRLFVASVLNAITASAKQPPHRVVFLLDEFAQLGYMKSIEDAVSLLRGYGLAFWVFLQDLSQIKETYPRWQTFLANSAKVFYGTADFETAKYVSDTLGQTTIEYETTNRGKNTGSGVSGGGGSLNKGSSSGSSQQLAGRALLTPDEVMLLGPERPIVLLKGEHPYILDRLAYYKDPEYVGLFDPNPYHS